MSQRISSALLRLRQDLGPYLDESDVRDLCKQHGRRWRFDALLDPFTTILWFIVQVLHGNTSLAHITLKARRGFSESAYCRSRCHSRMSPFPLRVSARGPSEWDLGVRRRASTRRHPMPPARLRGPVSD